MKVWITRDDNGHPQVELTATARTYSPDVFAELVQWANSLWSWVQDSDTPEVELPEPKDMER